jgi:hypothetical protein
MRPLEAIRRRKSVGGNRLDRPGLPTPGPPKSARRYVRFRNADPLLGRFYHTCRLTAHSQYRMAVGNRAAFDIDDVLGQAELTGDNDRDCGEAFIDLCGLDGTSSPPKVPIAVRTGSAKITERRDVVANLLRVKTMVRSQTSVSLYGRGLRAILGSRRPIPVRCIRSTGRGITSLGKSVDAHPPRPFALPGNRPFGKVRRIAHSASTAPRPAMSRLRDVRRPTWL